MAIRGATERRISELWNRPIEWLQGQSLRVLEWFNQERWTTLLTIVAIVLANLMVLQLLLQGQDNRAIAFVIFTLLAPLLWLIPEISIAVFLISGSSLLVNSIYFAAGPGGGTGERTFNTFLMMLITARAIYEYLRTPAGERPRIFSWFTIILTLFWLFYMGHVAYIYLFRYNVPPVDNIEAMLGGFRPGIFRYYDAHMFWIAVLPLIFLLRDLSRAKRVLMVVGTVLFLGVATLVMEYFTPLPMVWKIVFQIRGSGQSTEGYRVADAAIVPLMVFGFFVALYSLGYLHRGYNLLALVYLGLALFGVILTKNRALWAGVMVGIPFALFWKPPAILARQGGVLAVAAILFSVGMLHPQFNQIVVQKYSEAMQRWERNFAYGGDPRNDPSYQARLREKEAWDVKMSRLNNWERLFGKGLEEPYGHYLPLSVKRAYAYLGSRNAYYEKISMHMPWFLRLLQIGIIGTALMALTLIGALLRSAQAFLAVNHPFTRALLMGVGCATVALIGLDILHTGPLASPPSLPVIFLWSIAELTFHWQRTGQLSE